jgi:transcriptional regulator with XRE-family HTH domain
VNQGVSSLHKRFGDNLRKVRKAKDLSQEDLAAKAGLHRTYVSSVERGERNVTLETIDRLARALGVPMTRLMPD